jgi:hypothetical protein
VKSRHYPQKAAYVDAPICDIQDIFTSTFGGTNGRVVREVRKHPEDHMFDSQ